MGVSEIPENQSPVQQAKDIPLSSEKWIIEIKASEKWSRKWREQGRKVVRRYLDRRDITSESVNKINIFTSNVQILIATLYARFPVPVVTREFEDQDDDVARVAAEIIERCLVVKKRDSFDTALKSVVQDRLIPGSGNVWFRYEAEFQDIEIPAVILPDGTVESEAAVGQEIAREWVETDYVFWEDMFYSPGRSWESMRWVGRRVKMSKDDVTKRFGEVISGQISYKKSTQSDTETQGEYPEDDPVSYAEIYEIWCKRTKKVYWVCEGLEVVLDVKDDMLGLKEFFPCPPPLMATHSTSNYIPRPDYLLVQDQYEELDMVNNRITLLERAIKAVGVYDGNNAEIERIFTEGIDNKILPSRSFKDFMEKGGFKGSIDWIPIEAFVNALEKLRTYRQDLITQIYELTGISDIMRGSTKASETLGAQQLKAQYGSVKLQFLQMEVASFVECALEIKSEIIIGKFQPKSILLLSNIERSVDAPLAGPAIELLKAPNWEHRIEVNADSMAVPEFNAERDARMNFVRSVSEMISATMPISGGNPEVLTGMLKVVQWAATSFRTGRTIEGVLDQTIAAMEKAAAQPKPEQVDPAIEKAKIDAQNRGQIEDMKLQAEQSREQMRLENEKFIEALRLDNAQVLEEMKLASAERIALMKVHAEGIAAQSQINADLQKSEYETDSNMALEASKPDPGESLEPLVKPIAEAIKASADATKEMQDVLTALTENMTKPRIRTPKRDSNGDIISVEERIGD